MRGLSAQGRGEPVLNPSWANRARAQAPGWGINGPGVSAEWTQGGESEWNSAAASADETRAALYQELEVPRAGHYRLWVRYADWVGKTENFTMRVVQNEREVARREFGARPMVDEHDEILSYWGWAFAWDGGEPARFDKGPIRIYVEIEKPAEARRHVDCLLLTNDLSYAPEGRRKPDFAALRYLREWAQGARPPLTPLIANLEQSQAVPATWRMPPLAGAHDFLMPWNISPEFWKLYEKPEAERPLYPFHAEPIEEFVKKFAGARTVPIFASRLVVPVIYINDLPAYMKEESAFLRYLRASRSPFAVLINYGTVQMSAEEGRAAWNLLSGELRGQFIGWISGESIGHVWDDVSQHLRITPAMSRPELLDAYHQAYAGALGRKWNKLFGAPIGPMWNRLIPAQATSSTAYAHALGEWGVRTLGIETAAVQPITALRIAFTRGAARQYGANFLYYHAPNFGDTATTFTKAQNFAGPDNFFHSRYGATMGPSLAWYRKSYYLYFMSGAAAVYLEQGYDQFFKPGPGEHPFQLNPLGRITHEFVRFAERHHAERGTPYTPVAFLLDPAHGWDMTDYPHLPFGVSPINRGDRALRELFGAAYFPGPVVEGEPATAERQALVNGVFGDIFDVLVASDERPEAVDAYRALVVGGRTRRWSPAWAARLERYARAGGTVFLNSAQIDGLSEDFLGLSVTDENAEADGARCTEKNEAADLSGQVFRYRKIALRGAATRVLIATDTGDPLVTVRTVGRGRVVFCALPDLLGLDERLTPFAAHALAHLFEGATPVNVRGDVQYMMSRTARGWVVTLFNNLGVTKHQQGMAQVDRQAGVEAMIDLRGRGLTRAREWTQDVPLEVVSVKPDVDGVRARIAPGGVAVVELIEK